MKKYSVTISLISILVLSSIFFTFLQQTQAATTQVSCTVITADLWPNSKDSKTQGQVSKLQNFLIAEGYLKASPTGNLGPLTEAALQVFQKAQGIVSSGNYVSTGYGATGPKTRAAIKNVSCNGGTGAVASTSTLPLGCNPGYKFSTLTGQPCVAQLVTSGSTSSIPGCNPGALFSILTGKSCLVSTTATATQNNTPIGNTNTNTNTNSTNGNNSNTNTNNSGTPIPLATTDAVPTNYFTPQPGPNILVPGSGFSGATAQPAQIGTSTTHVIAHWDMVPYQTFTSTINVGVVAFDIHDVDHVAFSVNGGPWTNISQMTLNPETNVVEYWATLRASDFPDGQVEVRAIAYPKAGNPRVLQGTTVSNEESSLVLNSNAHGTLAHQIRYVSTTGSDSNNCKTEATACLTIAKAISLASTAGLGSSIDGVEIRLGEGSWQLPLLLGNPPWVPAYYTPNQWLTITSAPDVNPNNVQITGMDGASDSAGLGVTHVRLYNLAVVGYISKTLSGTYLWFDHVFAHMLDPNALYYASSSDPIQGWGPWSTYWTDVNMDNTGWGPNDSILARNVFADRTAGGHSSGSATVINYSVKTIYGSGYQFPAGKGPDVHGDVYFFYGRTSDVILYGIQTIPGGFLSTRGIVGFMTKDNAIVNANVNIPYPGWAFSTCNPIDNLVIKNSTFTGAGPTWCGENGGTVDPTQMTNILIDHSQFINGNTDNLVHPTDIPGIIYNPPLPPPAPTLTFTASPTGIGSGQTSTLTWSSTNSTSCTASNGWSGTQATSGTTTTAALKANTTFTLQCTGAGGTVTKSATVIITSSTPGLIGYWPFDGDTSDASGNGNDGVIVGNPAFVTGHTKQALSFDGVTNQYVTMGGTSLLAPSSGLTLSAWVNIPSGGGGYVAMRDCVNGPGDDYELNTSSLVLGDSSNGAHWLPANATLTPNTWHNIVGTFDGTSQVMSYYIDGALTNSQNAGFSTLQTSPPYGTGVFQVARDTCNQSGLFKGSIDDVRIYNRALSSSEVSQLYNGTLATKQNPANSANLANVLTSTLNLLPHAIPGTSYYNSLINTLNSALHSLGIK